MSTMQLTGTLRVVAMCKKCIKSAWKKWRILWLSKDFEHTAHLPYAAANYFSISMQQKKISLPIFS